MCLSPSLQADSVSLVFAQADSVSLVFATRISTRTRAWGIMLGHWMDAPFDFSMCMYFIRLAPFFLCCEKSKVYRGVESQNRGCVSNGKTDKQRVKTNKQTEQTSECRVVRHLTHLPSEGRTRLYRLKLILRASGSSALSSASP
jgi:hypothetical protein